MLKNIGRKWVKYCCEFAAAAGQGKAKEIISTSVQILVKHQ